MISDSTKNEDDEFIVDDIGAADDDGASGAKNANGSGSKHRTVAMKGAVQVVDEDLADEDDHDEKDPKDSQRIDPMQSTKSALTDKSGRVSAVSRENTNRETTDESQKITTRTHVSTGSVASQNKNTSKSAFELAHESLQRAAQKKKIREEHIKTKNPKKRAKGSKANKNSK